MLPFKKLCLVVFQQSISKIQILFFKYNFFPQGRKAEEQRAMRLAAELGQFRHEAERRLQEKEEEIEAIR